MPTDNEEQKYLPTGGVLQMPSLNPSEFQCTMLSFGFRMATLRFMSEIVSLPLISKQQAR